MQVAEYRDGLPRAPRSPPPRSTATATAPATVGAAARAAETVSSGSGAGESTKRPPSEGGRRALGGLAPSGHAHATAAAAARRHPRRAPGRHAAADVDRARDQRRDARRRGGRRRPHRLARPARRRRPRALRRRRDRARPRGRRASPRGRRARGGRSASSAPRCSPRSSTGSPWSRSPSLIVVAAIGRLGDPPESRAAGVLALGLVGLAGNVAATLGAGARGSASDINLEGVLRHSVADALGSVGVIVSGAVILATGWHPTDPLASLAIAALILASSVRLIREPLNVLMEAAPRGHRRRGAGARDLRGRGRARGPRAPRLDGDLGLRGARRPRRRRPGRRPRPRAPRSSR